MAAKILEKLKKREFIKGLALAGLVFAVLLVLFVVEFYGKIPYFATHMGYDKEEQVIYYLAEEDTIVQEFTSPKDFDMASLHFSDHELSIPGKTFISVMEKESGRQVCYVEKPNTDIHYGSVVELVFEEKGKAGIPYVVSVWFEEMGEKGLGIFGIPLEEEGKPAVVNGVRREYRILVGTHTYTSRFASLIVCIGLMGGILLLTSVILVTQTKLREEYLFLGIGIPMGVALLMFLSVNMVHDGATHLAKVYHYSNVLSGRGSQDKQGTVLLRGDEAAAFEELYDENHKEYLAMEMYWDTAEQFWEKPGPGEMVYSHKYRENNASSFLEYFPSIIGMALGRILGGSARFNILLAKMFSFSFYVLLVFYAIRISPHLKTAIAFAALLPMSMYQAAGITYDSVVMAASMLVFALFMKARTEPLAGKERLLLLGLSVVLGSCKGGFYLLLLLLFAVIPVKVFGSVKKKLTFCLGNLAFGAGGLTITYLGVYLPEIRKLFAQKAESAQIAQAGAAAGGRALDMVPETQTAACGIGYVFEEPFRFARMLVATLVQEIDQYVGSLVGYRMAWSDGLVPLVLVFGFLALVLIAGTDVEGAPAEVAARERLVAAFLLGLEALGFHILMLVETPLGAGVIKGVQGRYFLAWVPALVFALHDGRRKYDAQGIRRLYVWYAVAELFFLYSFLKIFLGIVH
ncbi:hypothetical protein IMSAGC019_00835 [Lachnospiraceae bacterium]|nr:hypothetical protein IMSAGC019_00835 [Lachnospiraceae bacterium]